MTSFFTNASSSSTFEEESFQRGHRESFPLDVPDEMKTKWNLEKWNSPSPQPSFSKWKIWVVFTGILLLLGSSVTLAVFGGSLLRQFHQGKCLVMENEGDNQILFSAHYKNMTFEPDHPLPCKPKKKCELLKSNDTVTCLVQVQNHEIIGIALDNQNLPGTNFLFVGVFFGIVFILLFSLAIFHFFCF